jgi:hypothetical protein
MSRRRMNPVFDAFKNGSLKASDKNAQGGYSTLSASVVFWKHHIGFRALRSLYPMLYCQSPSATNDYLRVRRMSC